MIRKFEDKVRITGIGQSRIGRRLGVDPVGLAIDACIAAMADAGLERADIDGLSSHPGPLTLNGYSGAGIADVERVLRVRPRWFNSGHEFGGQTGALVEAALAVAAGLARHVLVFRCTWNPPRSSAKLPPPMGVRNSGNRRRLPVDGPLRRVFPGKLDRALRQPPHAPLWHHARATGCDRHQRPRQCGAQPGRDLSRSADHGGLSFGAHDQHAVWPI
ncbi:hypothetical protein ACFS32_04815 [Novosphingobium pokkalii]|uniref:hypothetical protein n=1 Tax=Novosphingobium pokkalii TaxID=1770194 RepID=UPI00364442CC